MTSDKAAPAVFAALLLFVLLLCAVMVVDIQRQDAEIEQKKKQADACEAAGKHMTKNGYFCVQQ